MPTNDEARLRRLEKLIAKLLDKLEQERRERVLLEQRLREPRGQ